MIDGAKVIIGGKEYIFADIKFGTAQRIWPYIQQLNNPNDPGYLTAMLKVIVGGLQRNYPEITEDFIQDNLGYEEIPDLMMAVAQQLTKKKNQVILTPTTSLSIGEGSTPE